MSIQTQNWQKSEINQANIILKRWKIATSFVIIFMFPSFLGKVENLKSDVNYLTRTKLSMYQNLVQSVFENKLNKNQHKSEKTSHLYFQQLPKDLVIKLYSVFEDDFHLGGYDYPQTYLDAAAQKK